MQFSGRKKEKKRKDALSMSPKYLDGINLVKCLKKLGLTPFNDFPNIILSAYIYSGHIYTWSLYMLYVYMNIYYLIYKH